MVNENLKGSSEEEEQKKIAMIKRKGSPDRGKPKKVLIVESPTKSRKISSILGKEWKVVASFGHIRDLPEKTMGFSFQDILKGEVNVSWTITKRKVVSFIRKETEQAEEVILATDPDREGEAIAWHISQVLNIKEPKRIVFHEITSQAILNSLKNPRKIDMNLVHAQISRRLIDRVVGYTLSPVFWSIRKNSSAGRVQSAALHLIVKRWKEVRYFERKPYFIVYADFGNIEAFLYENVQEVASSGDGKGLLVRVKHFFSEPEAKELAESISSLYVSEFRRTTESKSPPPPYTTSSMLQDAKNLFRFSSDFTMKIAQNLFERGLITYHRTDSTHISEQGFSIAKSFFSSKHKDIENVGRRWKTKVANAQEAHECIRPTEEGFQRFIRFFDGIPSLSKLKDSNLNPYDKLLLMICFRFFSSQSKNALFDVVQVKFSSPSLPQNLFFAFKVKNLKFDGFLRLWNKREEDLSDDDYEGDENFRFALSFEFTKNLSVGQKPLERISYKKKFTTPPPLYTEATLIKELERLGVGRPSTYSTIIKTLKKRGYIVEEKGKLIPTGDGIFQDEVLEKYMPKICLPEFTASMEEELDSIARGEKLWRHSLSSMVRTYLEEFEKFRENFKEAIRNFKESSQENIGSGSSISSPKKKNKN